MYYAEYNPTLHDIYLYDASNTGYPIGINPNSLIAGASADFASVQIRQRRLSVAEGAIEIKSPPPGTSITYYPNYYNTNIPLNIIISDKIIGTNLHYSANIPSDSFSPAAGINEYAKYTGTTTAYPILSTNFWKPDMSGITTYGPFTGFYNFLPLNLLPTGYSFGNYVYFNGSPEIPAFSSGQTFYQILNNDFAFSNLLNVNQTIAADPIKIISVFEILTDEQKENFENYLITLFGQSGTASLNYSYVFSVTNVYYWDGNDKCIPVSKIGVKFQYRISSPLQSVQAPPYNNIPFDPTLTIYFGENDELTTGDSTGQLIYLNNNKLYFMGGGFAAGFSREYTRTKYPQNTNPFIAYARVVAYQRLTFTNLQGLDNLPIDRNHYSTTLNSGITLATQIDFNRVKQKFESIITKLNTLLADLSN